VGAPHLHRPGDGQLAAIDARRRFFDGPIRQLLIARDQWCRTPWCDAPIRHADHVRSAAGGGETELGNGQGLCEACNQSEEAPGWQARPVEETASEVETTTLTGHRYRSRPPDPPRTRRPELRPRSHLEAVFGSILVGAA
jgi:hypothetical protein